MQKCEAHDSVVISIAKLETALKFGVSILLFVQIIIAPILTGLLWTGLANMSKKAEAADGNGRAGVSSEYASIIDKRIDIAYEGDRVTAYKGTNDIQNSPINKRQDLDYVGELDR